MIKFVGDLQQVGGFLRVLRFTSPIKLNRHDITEIWLKVVLSTITLTTTKMINNSFTKHTTLSTRTLEFAKLDFYRFICCCIYTLADIDIEVGQVSPSYSLEEIVCMRFAIPLSQLLASNKNNNYTCLYIICLRQ